MKKNGFKWTIGILSILVIAIGGFLIWKQVTKPVPMFAYEECPDPRSSGTITMAIRQMEGLEYSIEPYADLVVSEPTPDWGIMVRFTDNKDSSLYFFSSVSMHVNWYNGDSERESIEINGKPFRWSVDGDYIVGDYEVSTCIGITVKIERPLWDENREVIVKLIESAEIR